MKKNPLTLHRRQRDIKRQVNLYQKTKGITRDEAVKLVADELYLSPDTVYKDYYK